MVALAHTMAWSHMRMRTEYAGIGVKNLKYASYPMKKDKGCNALNWF